MFPATPAAHNQSNHRGAPASNTFRISNFSSLPCVRSSSSGRRSRHRSVSGAGAGRGTLITSPPEILGPGTRDKLAATPGVNYDTGILPYAVCHGSSNYYVTGNGTRWIVGRRGTFKTEQGLRQCPEALLCWIQFSEQSSLPDPSIIFGRMVIATVRDDEYGGIKDFPLFNRP
ncbi:hypothetical protein GEV33_009970 [Tenebrio molitor]|uniref:Uncharacterized protein n=1 Tax=Tenebrio molitor TaxID=7067 RepID=A0A8J6HDT0_TENMO|nr:hypothetical protein GEV33_009970 [Tenebrio molitor]